MAKASHRDRILDAGLKVMFHKGYIGSGVRDIVAEALAPQGSFTNHFRSKEVFAREVLDRYFDRLKGLAAQVLDDRSLSPRQRLRRYLDVITERLKMDDFRRGCLIGDFSLEAAPQSDMLRERLAAIFITEWRAPFAACIAEAQTTGEIATTFTPDGSRRIPARLLGGGNPAHEGRTQPGASRTLQADRIRNSIQEGYGHADEPRHRPAADCRSWFNDGLS